MRFCVECDIHSRGRRDLTGYSRQYLINPRKDANLFFIYSTQFQQERKIVIELDASTESPGERGKSTGYFAPVASKSTTDFGSEWGKGEDIYIEIEVQDTGCGLTALEMEKLFMRFSQASPKTHVQYGVRWFLMTLINWR